MTALGTAAARASEALTGLAVIAALFATALAGAAIALAPGGYRVIDGDTLGRPAAPAIRLWGIDAPEAGTPAGDAATAALAALVAGRALSCRPMDRDRYGRTVARCRLPDGRDAACAMVAAGHARDWPRFSGGAYRECGR